jgi:hypothetical protein
MIASRQLQSFEFIREWLISDDIHLVNACLEAERSNPWFTQDNIKKALEAIATDFLDPKRLLAFLAMYPEIPVKKSLKIGVVSAGNIPMVGFHDLLCILLSGHEAYLKLSSKDSVLMYALRDKLKQIDAELASKITFNEYLQNLDAYIATGSNNSVRYFEAYFGKYPNIIRRNRQSVAVLDGRETNDELILLGHDVFSYFGLGCRNISQLLVPMDYDFQQLLTLWQAHFVSIIEHNAYRNNYDYNYAIYLLNKEPFLMNGCIILRESEELASRIACVHYKRIENKSEISEYLNSNMDKIQCIVSRTEISSFKTHRFGEAQKPGLYEYADGIDTMKFLMELNND